MVRDFAFSEHAADFDAHIAASIPGHDRLRWWQENLARRFVQQGTRVVDVGCSTGSSLRGLYDAIHAARPDVEFVGIDINQCFKAHWRRMSTTKLRFEACDALSFDGFENVSLALARFTLQFIEERKKIGLLQRIYESLVEGGALLIAEKTLIENPVMQDHITFAYYDHKAMTFSAEQILDKERRLRGVMTPWTRARLVEALCAVGFGIQDIGSFWQDAPFIALVAMKHTTLRANRSVRVCTRRPSV